MMKATLPLVLAAALLAGCGGAAKHASPAPSLRDPIAFPLYSNARIVSAHAFKEIVRASSADSAFAQGNGIYAGHEVIASSTASFATLSAWLQGLDLSPPAGYLAQDSAFADSPSRQYGLDYAVFEKRSGGKTQGVLAVVMDPHRLDRRFGVILGMIDKYKALPAILRRPIDAQAKARYGMSVSQATAPGSPLGAALAALGELEHENARGIVIIDARKR